MRGSSLIVTRSAACLLALVSACTVGQQEPASGAGAGNASAPRLSGTGGADAPRPAAEASGTSGATAGTSATTAGGAPAHAGAGGAAGAAGGEPSTGKPRCLEQDSELVVLGDSYLNWVTHTFPEDFAREFGGDSRLYAEPGASMASGGIATPVPEQLAMAIADDPEILAGVMTGGGNDILLADTLAYPGSDECKERADSPTLQVCQDVIAAALMAAKDLTRTGADAGIEDVIYIYYPRIPGALLGIFATSPNEILDYSMPMARAMCDQTEADTDGKLRCHFLDLQPIFEGHPDWFADDGIHENATGSAVIAQEIVKLMKARCIAQREDSGCCAP